MTLDRRSMLALAATSGLPIDQTPSAHRDKPRTSVDVKSFGARGDGRKDDTEAFNRATRAAEPWSTDLQYAIVVPAGTYRIDGTVYLRKGQTLIGEGHSSLIDARQAQLSTFLMGTSSKLGRGGQDPGGAPVRIQALRTLGGSTRQGLIYTNVAGFSISGLFMTASGIALEIEGNDGLVSDVYIDQALNAVVLRGAQSIVMSGLIFYSANFAMSIGGSVRALTVANSIFSFCRYAAVDFEDGSSGSTALLFDACTFIENEQYDTFIGFVHCRAQSVAAHFNACEFRNWPRYAVNQPAAGAADFLFSACRFDGRRSSADHNNSSTAAGIFTGAGGDYRFRGCEFRSLQGPVIAVAKGLTRLMVEGGLIDGVGGARFSVPGSDLRTDMIVRNVDGLHRMGTAGGGAAVIIPELPGLAWRVQVSGRSLVSNAPLFRDLLVPSSAAAATELARVDAGQRDARTGGTTPVRLLPSGEMALLLSGWDAAPGSLRASLATL